MPPSEKIGDITGSTLSANAAVREKRRNNDSKQSLYHVTYVTISLQPRHAETFVFLTFPTGHEETTPPIGGGFSDARFALSSEISLSRACSTATPRSRQFL